MKLYVCYGLFGSPRPGGHPCKNAADALEAAGHHPQVVKSYGLGMLPKVFNLTAGRRRVEELTGNRMVPTLELDDGTVVDGSDKIIAWAQANPA
ncbi:MAG: hypothetical protein NVSMB51_10240 [Solirubrobacteraceae bacterium]